MIHTVGYDHMTPAQLVTAMAALKIDYLVDVRSVPRSRRPGFSQNQLRAMLQGKYVWSGDVLGGRGDGPSQVGLEMLAKNEHRMGRGIILLCKEEAPEACHRHHTIAMPLYRQFGIDCIHVFQNNLVPASVLQAAIDTGLLQTLDCETWR